MIRIASAFLALVFPALANASDSVDSLQSYRHLGGAAFSKYHSLIFETLGPHGVYSVTPSDYKPKRIDCFTPYADGPAVPDGALPASEHFPWVVKKARNYLLNSPERQFIAVRPDGSDCKHLDLSDEDRLMMVPRTDFLAKVSGKVFSLLDLRTLHEIELFRATEIQTFALKSSPDGKFLVVSYAKGGEAEKCVEHRLYEMPSLRMLGKSELKTEDYESGNPYPACRASNPVFIGKNLYLHAKGYMGSYANRILNWNIDNPEIIKEYESADSDSSFQFLPDDQMILKYTMSPYKWTVSIKALDTNTGWQEFYMPTNSSLSIDVDRGLLARGDKELFFTGRVAGFQGEVFCSTETAQCYLGENNRVSLLSPSLIFRYSFEKVRDDKYQFVKIDRHSGQRRVLGALPTNRFKRIYQREDSGPIYFFGDNQLYRLPSK